jgi:hypothetical protein
MSYDEIAAEPMRRGSLSTAGIHREEDDGRIVLRSERPHVLRRYRLCPIDPRRRPGP